MLRIAQGKHFTGQTDFTDVLFEYLFILVLYPPEVVAVCSAEQNQRLKKELFNTDSLCEYRVMFFQIRGFW
jgi:hypothetical protein